MTGFELIDRLCKVNSLLCDIVKEQAAIMEQHGIEEIRTEEECEESLSRLYGMKKRAEEENDAIEVQLRKYM